MNAEVKVPTEKEIKVALKVLANVDKLIAWYRDNRSSVKRVALAKHDYESVKLAVSGVTGVTERDGVLTYREFTLYAA
jgi:hypothetical protein